MFLTASTNSIVLLICLFLSSGSALAQTKQTPENAQRFLGGAVVSHNPERSFFYENGGWNRPWSEHSRKWVADPAQPIKKWSAKSDDVCISEYEVRQRTIDNDKVELGSGWETDRIRWKHVGKVEQKDTSVEIRVRNNKFRITWPSEALAARAAYAMEFLRMYCDTTADTGF